MQSRTQRIISSECVGHSAVMSLMIRTAHQILFGSSIKKNEMGGAGSLYGVEVHTEFWWGNMKERDHLEDPDLDRRIILKRTLKKWDRAWTGLIWLRIGTDGVLL